MRELREREVTGESESEGERESYVFYLNDCGSRGQKLYELGTPCPEYPGLRPEYPGRVLQMMTTNLRMKGRRITQLRGGKELRAVSAMTSCLR